MGFEVVEMYSIEAFYLGSITGASWGFVLAPPPSKNFLLAYERIPFNNQTNSLKCSASVWMQIVNEFFTKKCKTGFPAINCKFFSTFCGTLHYTSYSVAGNKFDVHITFCDSSKSHMCNFSV